MKLIIIIAVLGAAALGYFLYKRGDQDGDGDVDLKDIKISANKTKAEVKQKVSDVKEKAEDIVSEAKDVVKKVRRKKPGRKPQK